MANKCFEECLISLAIRQMQTITTRRLHLTPVRRLSSRTPTVKRTVSRGGKSDGCLRAGGTVGGAITVEIWGSLSQTGLADEPAFHSCAHAQRTQCSTVEILTHPCFLMLSLQSPGNGSILEVHQLMNGQ